MILRFTLDLATLIGETSTEWDTLERQARAGHWTAAPLAQVERLRALAADLGVPLYEEGSVPGRRQQCLGVRRSPPTQWSGIR